MAHAVTTFLMFEGAAEEALTFYVSLFPRSAVHTLERWGAEAPGREATVKRATFTVGGLALVAMDSPIHHDFTFTPALSLFVECESAAELDDVYARLAEGGTVLMPVGEYGFSKRFGWVNDRFGVSWQLNLV